MKNALALVRPPVCQTFCHEKLQMPCCTHNGTSVKTKSKQAMFDWLKRWEQLWWCCHWATECILVVTHSTHCYIFKKPIFVSTNVENIYSIPAAAAKSLQSCPTLCDSIDSSPPGSPIPGILQTRTLEWVVISFSNAWKWKVKGKSLSRVRL